jgi:hypothetical protein
VIRDAIEEYIRERDRVQEPRHELQPT